MDLKKIANRFDTLNLSKKIHLLKYYQIHKKMTENKKHQAVTAKYN